MRSNFLLDSHSCKWYSSAHEGCIKVVDAINELSEMKMASLRWTRFGRR
jgi:hypothetical protein